MSVVLNLIFAAASSVGIFLSLRSLDQFANGPSANGPKVAASLIALIISINVLGLSMLAAMS
jgi:hypothetical protein